MNNEAKFISNLRGELRIAIDGMKALQDKKSAGFGTVIDIARFSARIETLGAILKSYDAAQKSPQPETIK